ncbi:MAG TPA: amylo-alpha-1,6-glucosidase, partial [Candidatus Nanoarchaeia archaeon]|nr:amylo-alpha-1,6-glucosidase [Candidatus Nanoarchaeia archaeon]
MKVAHCSAGKKISTQTQDDKKILLTNNLGNYLLLGKPESRYDGFFVFNEMQMFRILESVEAEGKVTEVTNNIWNVQRKRGEITETFFLPDNTNSLLYETDRECEAMLSFDIKESYDSSEWGRNYHVEDRGNLAIIRFSGKREMFVGIAFDGNCRVINKWTKREYSGDRIRDSPPFERYVFQALSVKGKRVVISAGKSEDEVVKECELVKKSFSIKKKGMQKPQSEVDFAYICAKNALNSLALKEGVIAGLPWFFQFWSRDMLVSAKALNRKDILLSLIEKVMFDGRIQNRMPPTEAQSADSIGWLFRRLSDFMDKLDDMETERVSDWLLYSIDGLLTHHTKDDFDYCGAQETWMDSISRDGCRIELQALRLNMYKLAYELTEDEKFREMELRLKEKTKKGFFRNGILFDGLNDSTIRPNLFIAAYVYPELLSQKEWSLCLENALKRLWLPWGGISTIDTSSPLFQSEHTGENPKSYHNGDSWFWLNNLAALVMYGVDKKKFKQDIDAIIKSST